MSYYLMPFYFERLSKDTELIVNEVGDYLYVNVGTTEKIINRKINPSSDFSLYYNLISNYIISEKKIHPLINVLATKYRTKKEFLENFTGLHIFVMTIRCDNQCEYCQVTRQNSNNNELDISIDALDKSIDLMLRSPSKNLTMEFQGGEPLLVFDKIKYAILETEVKAKQLDKNITYVICTNLNRIDSEKLEFIKQYNVLISTSLDGPEFIHNKNRILNGGNSYQSVVANIKNVRETLGADRISALMTTTKESLKYPIEIVDEYRNQNFSSIFLRAINPYGYAVKNKINSYETDHFIAFYKKALDYIIKLNLNGEFFIEDYARIILKKILTPFNIGFVDLQSPSGAVTGVIVYNRDGNVYISDEARMLGEMGIKRFSFGNVLNDKYETIFYGENVANLTDYMVNESLNGCSNCAFHMYCGADPVQNFATQNSCYGHRPSSSFCKKNKEIIKHFFKLMNDNNEILNVFKNWVLN